jgi:hypothetical protein
VARVMVAIGGRLVRMTRRSVDRYGSPDRDYFIQRDDIPGAHPNAAVARRLADTFLFRRSVDVDAARGRIAIAAFQTAQTQHSRHDGIAAGRVGCEHFAGEMQSLQNRPDRQAIADFPRDR